MSVGLQVPARWVIPRIRTHPTARARAEARALPATTVHPIVRGTLLLFVFSIAFDWWSPELRLMALELPTATGALLLASSLLDLRACYRRMPTSAYGFFTYLWVFVAAVIALAVPQGALAARLFVNLLLVVMIFWVLTNLFDDARLLRSALIALVIACGARAVIQLAGVGTVESVMWTGGVRVQTFGQNYNLSALILAGGLTATLGFRWSALAPPRWLMLLGWPLVATMAAAIIQTGSRGGLAAALLGVSVYFLRGATIGARIRNAILTMMALALIAVAAWNTPMMRSRIEQSAVEGSLAGRERIYPAAFGMFLERPLLGWGPIANQYEIGRRFPAPNGKGWRDAHNLVLELLTSTGIAGALPFLFGLVLIGRSAWRARRGEAGLLPLSLVAAGIGGTISGTWITSKVMWFGFAVAVATARRADAGAPRLDGGA